MNDGAASTPDLAALWLSLRLALITTTTLLLVGTPLAWWLATTRSRFKTPIEAIVALPLVLPPTVLGFYLLVSLSPRGWIGAPWASLGAPPLVFSFLGLVIGSVFYSLPFVVQPLQSAFESTSSRYLEAAATLRAAPMDRFFSVALPLARRGAITAAVLGFAHTLGEFGIVLMLGGNIPDRTRTASIAIYDHVESLEYAPAHQLSLILLAVSFALLWTVFLLNRRWKGTAP